MNTVQKYVKFNSLGHTVSCQWFFQGLWLVVVDRPQPHVTINQTGWFGLKWTNLSENISILTVNKLCNGQLIDNVLKKPAHIHNSGCHSTAKSLGMGTDQSAMKTSHKFILCHLIWFWPMLKSIYETIIDMPEFFLKEIVRWSSINIEKMTF